MEVMIMNGFDDIFEEFDKLFKDEMKRMRKFITMMGNIPKDDIMERFKSDEPIVWGFTYRWGTGMEKPEIRYFGNVKPEKPVGIRVDEEVTPFYDVYKKDDGYEVVVELPGAEKKDVDLSVRGTELIVNAKTKYKTYSATIKLPSEVDTENVEAKMNNGILMVKLKKSESGGKKIRILD